MKIKKLMPLILVLLVLLILITFRVYTPKVDDKDDDKSGIDRETFVVEEIVLDEEAFEKEEAFGNEEALEDGDVLDDIEILADAELSDEKPMIDDKTTLKKEAAAKESDIADIEAPFDADKKLEAKAPIDIKPVCQEKVDKSVDETVNTENPELVFTYEALSEEVMNRIRGVSYIENDKIKMEGLSYLRLSHWGFDGKVHLGELIVNEKIASEVVEIFKDLYEAEFLIEKMKLIDDYDAKDSLSMEDNNSSAFCFREIAGSKGVLSQHSFGLAIDINPVQNPYVKNGRVYPEGGKAYLDRNDIRKGMIVKGDPAYKAFKSRGWNWGGDWNSLKDYQHFEFKLD